MTYIGRFGISMLATSRQGEAFPWEVMIDHNIGNISVKNDIGDTISYDNIDRLDKHVDTFQKICVKNTFYGDIYNVEPTDAATGDLIFPGAIPDTDFDKIISLNNSFTGSGNATTFSYSIDAVLVSIDRLGNYRMIENDIEYELTTDVDYTQNGTEFIDTVVITGNKYTLPEKITYFNKDKNPAAQNCDIKLKSIRLLNTPTVPTGEKMRLIIFSILSCKF